MTVYIGYAGGWIASTDPRYETEYQYIDKIEVPDDYKIPENAYPRIEEGELFWDPIVISDPTEFSDPSKFSDLSIIKNEIDSV